MESDFRWFHAAYDHERGFLRELLYGGLDRAGFEERMIEIISAADHDWILEARSPKGQHGVGLVLAKSFAAGRAIEPHVDWFPWATRRNKIESMAAFFRQVGKMFKIFIFSPEDETKVWGWYAKRRMLTRGGQIVDHFAVGQHARLFYTRGP